jgi:hypothetical protein
MGMARILVNGAPGKSYKYWDYCTAVIPKYIRGRKVKPGCGLKKAQMLAKLTGSVVEIMKGRKAYPTLEERKEIFYYSAAISWQQVLNGDFDVAVVRW